MSNRRRAALPSVALVLSLVLGAGQPPAPALAADPNAEAGAKYLAQAHGGTPVDYQLVHERSTPAQALGEPMWAGKYLDLRTGDVRTAYVPQGGGSAGSVAVMDENVRDAVAAKPLVERKADGALASAIGEAAPTKSLPVAIWLDVDTEPAEAEVRAAHPEVTWLANRPVVETMEQIRALRAELWEARRKVITAAAERFRGEIEALGGQVAYVSTSTPLVFVDLPAGAVGALAERAEVRSLGLEEEWGTHMSSAGPAVAANWTSGAGDQGNGVRVGVVEYHNSQATGDLSGQVARRYSTTGRIVTGIHPTWVAGAIASRSSTWRGVAPGADIVSASTGGYNPSLSTDRAIIAAADWAISPSGGDVDVLNASIGQDTATGAEEARRYFDSIGWEDGRLVVAASGNHSTFGNWDVASPGTGYNVLTVGGVDDRGTGATGDDRLWYGSDGAAYRDRTDASWNQHGDYNKPNLSAPAANVRTANGTIGSGTSVASPIVAGIAAQLIARAPTLAAWPEASRAILMAGAFRRTPMPGGGSSADHEGVGTASALWSNRVLDRGPFGGWAIGSFEGGVTVAQNIAVVKGQRVRLALAWSSHTGGSSNTGKSDHLRSDLDLVVRQPNGSVTGSYSWDNSYEYVTLTAAASGTMRVEIRASRFDTSAEPYGLAWSLNGPFTDAVGSKFYAPIMWVAARNIMKGCTATRFCHKQFLTRGQLAGALANGLGLPQTNQDFYSDDNGHRYENDINRLAAAGLTRGCGNGDYCPEQRMRRGPMATAIAWALNLRPTSTDYFTDDDGNRHEANINRIAAAGITSGCGDGKYCHNYRLRRAQAAAFLRNAFD